MCLLCLAAYTGSCFVRADVQAAEAPSAGTPVVVPTPAELAPSKLPRRDVDVPLPDATPRELGKPEDDVRVDVSEYSVDTQAPAALREALPRLTKAFTGPGRSFEDLVNAATEVTRFLQRDLGYYLGYAYIPEQEMTGHVVRIAVLEGRLDRVVLNWRDDLPVRKDVVQAYLDRLQPGAILTVKDVERAVFLLNDLRGISVRAEVKAGSQPGTAILEFTPRADARVSGSVDFDLNGSRYIGAERLGAQVTLASPFGRGDGLTGTVLGSLNSGLKFGLVGYTTPVNGDGLKMGLSLSALEYQLDKAEFPLGLNGTGFTANLFALYPWVRSRNLNLFALVAANDKSYVDRVLSIATRKRVDDIAAGLSGDFRDSFLRGGGVNTFELTLDGGRVRYESGTPSGLDDAKQFTKATFAFSRLQAVLDNRLLAYVAMHGQWSFNNLDTTEQFRAGGPDGVRAFAPGEGSGDSGAVLTTELRLLPPESWTGRWSRELVFAAFADAAYVRFREDPTLAQQDPAFVNHTSLAGVGLSLVWVRPGSYALRISVANPVHGEPKSDTRIRKPRVYAQGSWQF